MKLSCKKNTPTDSSPLGSKQNSQGKATTIIKLSQNGVQRTKSLRNNC